jgi:hypothetical protein
MDRKHTNEDPRDRVYILAIFILLMGISFKKFNYTASIITFPLFKRICVN